jgi:endogenous inhibitor of DNA gyrase (YacG/DUF329 family)
MSKMSTTPVFACRVCGKPVVVSNLTTYVNDPDGKLLQSLMKAMSDIALCPSCQRKRDWYARQNREAEFLANELNPNVVLYNVQDTSGVGWYASGVKEADRGSH